jgi:hypothetical protein
MKTSVAIKADVLKTFIQEDRNEIRITRDRIHNITTTIVIASFAITAFFFGNQNVSITKKAGDYTVLIDIFLMCLMIMSFLILKRVLVNCRKSLKARQNLLNNLAENDQTDLDPFPNTHEVKADIFDRDLYFFVGMALALLIVKLIIGMQIFGS